MIALILCQISKELHFHAQIEILPMLRKCLIKENIDKNEKKTPGTWCPVFWFTSLVVWIFIIKQVMYFSIIISFLFTSGNNDQLSNYFVTCYIPSQHHHPSLTYPHHTKYITKQQNIKTQPANCQCSSSISLCPPTG